MMGWRPMAAGDLDAVMDIAARLHPNYPERMEIFADKWAFHPQACRVLADGAAVLGYGFAHRWQLGRPPRLDAVLGDAPGRPDCLHLHDVALMPQARGQGGVALYLDHLEEVAAAERLGHLSLIAIAGKDGYWRGQGFGDFAGPADDLAERLASYGQGTVYLVRRLTKLKESDT